MEVVLQFRSSSELYKVLREPYLVQSINRGFLGNLSEMIHCRIDKSFLYKFRSESKSFDFDCYIEWLCSGFDEDFFVLKQSHLLVEPIVGDINCPFHIDSKIEFLKAFLQWYVESEKINLFTLHD